MRMLGGCMKEMLHCEQGNDLNLLTPLLMEVVFVVF